MHFPAFSVPAQVKEYTPLISNNINFVAFFVNMSTFGFRYQRKKGARTGTPSLFSSSFTSV